MTDLKKLSGPRLRALIQERSDVVVAARRGYIAQGLGHERISETRAKAKAGDPAAKALVDADDAWLAASDELTARRRYHGGDGPIKG